MERPLFMTSLYIKARNVSETSTAIVTLRKPLNNDYVNPLYPTILLQEMTLKLLNTNNLWACCYSHCPSLDLCHSHDKDYTS